MKTHLKHKFLSVRQKMAADGKPACERTRIVTDSARKRNRKEVLANYNKTRLNTGRQHDVGWN
jgi:succinylarginine dihydrolase